MQSKGTGGGGGGLYSLGSAPNAEYVSLNHDHIYISRPCYVPIFTPAHSLFGALYCKNNFFRYFLSLA